MFQFSNIKNSTAAASAIPRDEVRATAFGCRDRRLRCQREARRLIRVIVTLAEGLIAGIPFIPVNADAVLFRQRTC